MKAEHKAILIAVGATIAGLYLIANFGGRDLCNMLGLRYKGKACSHYDNKEDCEAGGCTWDATTSTCKRE